MIEVLAFCFGVVIFFLTISWYAVQFRYLWKLRKVPGPTPLPVVGNALELVPITEYLQKLLKLKQKYGGIFKLFIGFQKPLVVVSDYKFLEFVLNSTKLIEKADFYKFLQPVIGEGLGTSSGAKWRTRRKMIAPAFNIHILEGFIEIYENNAEILTSKLQREKGKSLDIHPYLALCMLDIICETAMGLQINAQNSASDYSKRVHDMLAITIERMFSVLKQNDFLYTFTNTYKKEKEASEKLHSTTLSIIKQRRLEITQMDIFSEDSIEVGKKRNRAFLDLLLHYTVEEKPLSDEDIKEEVTTFMLAGHDTTAAAVSFTLYNLSKHPEIQKKVVEEQRAIFGNDKFKRSTYEDLQQMKYLEAVIKETLRVYPPGPFIGRKFDKDTEYDGVIYPKGTSLILHIQGVHTDPLYYPEPDKFDPDRFLVEDVSKRFPTAFLPFSAGPRNCIGQTFAMLDMKSVLSHVLRRYEILPAIPKHEPRLAPGLVIRSTNGVFIRINDRNE